MVGREYEVVRAGIAELLAEARRATARSVNAIMTLAYREIGRRIVEFEQSGKQRVAYGEALLDSLADDLTTEFGRGFSGRNLRSMRTFYREWPIRKALSSKSQGAGLSTDFNELIQQTLSSESESKSISLFPLPWSHYLRLMKVKGEDARRFYEGEAIRGGWSVRQLSRQIGSQFYERTALSKNKAAMIRRGRETSPEDELTPAEQIKDPLVLEFLDLKDEYSESDLEEALIHKLEDFLLELGGEFAFAGRQRRLRIGNAWYRIDLLFITDDCGAWL